MKLNRDLIYRQSAAFVLLLTMVALLVVRSVHLCYHAFDHHSECVEMSTTTPVSSNDGHNEEECGICNFQLSPFTTVDPLTILGVVALIAALFQQYIQHDSRVVVVPRCGRAPPVAIS
ncbi:MAG: hypothetical protein SNH63_04060 [Rikenellaceae bacterium]